MNRREVVALIGSAAMWPSVARTQQPAMPVIGFLSAGSLDGHARPLSGFHSGLSDMGFVEGKTLRIEYRWGDGHYDRMPAMAADLVGRKVSAIAAMGDTSTRATKGATNAIPVVFSIVSDPVDSGLVASLNRPGGNLTGVTRLATDLEPKRLELLRQILPNARLIAQLVNPRGSIEKKVIEDVEAAASAVGQQIRIVRAATDEEVAAAFATLIELRANGLVISANTFFNSRSEQLGALALQHSIPAIYQTREFAVAGGLMSYGASLTDAFRLVGIYVGRILKGEKTADLPVQQASKIELVFNLKTAKALGLTVPPTLLARADEVIE